MQIARPDVDIRIRSGIVQVHIPTTFQAIVPIATQEGETGKGENPTESRDSKPTNTILICLRGLK